MRKFLTALSACVALASPSWAAMSDSEFLDLCSSGSVPRLEIAVENGANVNAKDQDGVTALMRAARDNFHPVVLHILLGAGADTDARDKDGKPYSIFIGYSYSATTNCDGMVRRLSN